MREPKRRIRRSVSGFAITLGMTALLAGCSTDALLAPDSDIDVQFAKSASHQSTDLLEFGNLANVVGDATLVRNGNGMSVSITMEDVEAGVYTIWGATFDAPENCFTAPCGLLDLGNAAAEASLSRVTGRVVGTDGTATFSGRLREGTTSDNLFGGLEDAQTAEAHFIVRTHGPPIPGLVAEMLHSVDGGCDVNDCDDVAVAIFLPPA